MTDNAETSTSRVVLVTGAGRGIGRAIALRLGEDGHRVAVHWRNSGAEAEAVRAEIVQGGGRAITVSANLRSPKECLALVAEVERELGPVELLVCNAGVARGGPLTAVDVEAMRETVETNLIGPMCLSAAVARGMLRRRFGRFVMIGSPVGLHGGLQGQAAYSASKAGLIGLARTIANELGPRGDITANVVSPGVIPTDLSRVGIDEIGDRLREGIPLGRFGSTADVAACVSFLLGPEASYITGQELLVDGGYSLKYISRRRAGQGDRS